MSASTGSNDPQNLKLSGTSSMTIGLTAAPTPTNWQQSGQEVEAGPTPSTDTSAAPHSQEGEKSDDEATHHSKVYSESNEVSLGDGLLDTMRSASILADTVRRNTLSGMDFASMDELDLSGNSSRKIFVLPNFSTVSLLTVWTLTVLGSVLCFVLAEVYQKDYFTNDFPLSFVASMACHLSVLSALVVYLLGRQRHGARVYRFYQPFAGGQRFVVLQFFGVFCLVVSFLTTVAYVQLLNEPENVRPGVLLVTAALTMVGSIFLFLSPRYFELSSSSSSFSSSPSSGKADSATLTFSGLLDTLRRSPNTESAIVCCISGGQTLISIAAHYAREITVSSAAIVLISQICNGVLIHYFIGCRSRKGYRFLMFRLPRTFDTLTYGVLWALFLTSLTADNYCLQVSRQGLDKMLPTSFFYGMLALNTYSALGLLFFVRSTTFRKSAMAEPTTTFEYASVLIITIGPLLALFSIGTIGYLQLHADELVSSEEGVLRAQLLRVGYFLVQGFALLLTPMVQATGRTMHGASFSLFRRYRGFPSFLLLQAYAWLGFVSSVFCSAMYFLTDNESAGVAAAVTASISSLSLVSSLREFSWIKLRLMAAKKGDDVGADSLSHPLAEMFMNPDANDDGDDDETHGATQRGGGGGRLQHGSPTLAEAVQASKLPYPKQKEGKGKGGNGAGGMDILLNPAAGDCVPMGNSLDEHVTQVTDVMNGEMIMAILFAVGNVMVRIVMDVSVHHSIGKIALPVVNMAVVSHWLFMLSVPLAHVSGRGRGIEIMKPFHGSSTYVALQVLGWFTYALFLIGILISGILTFNNSQLPPEWVRAFDRTSFASTLAGLLQLVPLVLLIISITYESVVIANRDRRCALAQEAFTLIRDVLREHVQGLPAADDRAVMQLAFTTLIDPARQLYDMPLPRKELRLMDLAQQVQQHQQQQQGLQNNGGSEGDPQSPDFAEFPLYEAAGHDPYHYSREDYDEEDEEDDDLADSAVTDPRERRRKHESVRLIVILMSCAAATLYVVAAFVAHVTAFALACAVCGLLLCTVDCIGVHVGYGMVLYGKMGHYYVLMPFRGGSAYVYRQIAGWVCYASTFLITLIAALEEEGTSAGAMVLAAGFAVASQVFILESVPCFTPSKPGQQSFLEQNGEGVVAVLAFIGSVSFAHVYDRMRAFFSVNTLHHHLAGADGEEGGLFSGDSGVFAGLFANPAHRSRVPFVMALLSIVVAVPFVLVAMARTTRQWEKIARRARREMRQLQRDNEKDSKNASTTASATTPSKRRCRSSTRRGTDEEQAEGDRRQQRSLKRGLWAVALTNLLEVSLILFTAVTPFSVIFLVYYVTHNFSPRLLDVVTSYLPTIFAAALGTLLLSVVPYLANVGVPAFAIRLRINIVTYCLYGMPLVVGSVLLAPFLIHPSASTRYLLFTTVVVTVLGNYRQVRRAIKFGVYSLFGYATYQLCLSLHLLSTDSEATVAPLTKLAIAKLLACYVLDCAALFFWIWYLPLFHGRPELSGAHRSLAFTEFARRYLWEDAARFFDFKIILDDPKMDLRDGKSKYLFSFHPHGVFPGTALFCSLTKEWQRKVGTNNKCYVSTHAASVVFNVPLIRDFNLRLGALSVSRRGLEASLSRGNSVLIVTGGQAEMLHTSISDKELILVTQHQGFVRLAMRNKVPLVPMLCFGEQNVMGLLQFPRIQKVMLKILGFPFPMVPYGGFGLPLPRRTPLRLVVGSPMEIPADADPESDEDVNALTKKYFDAIHTLFYKHREAAGYPEIELKLVNDKEEAAKRRAEREAKLAVLKEKIGKK